MTPLDPQVKALLDQMAAANQPAFHSQSPADARKAMARFNHAGRIAASERLEPGRVRH